MTFCEFCGDEIGYLPFKCKYCGGTFCKKHRLPENHECTFELKHTPVVPLGKRDSYSKTNKKREIKVEKAPKTFKKYLKRQEKRFKTRRSNWYQDYGATKILLIIIVVSSITTPILVNMNLGSYILFSLNGLLFNYAFHTILTSLFIIQINNIIEIFFLVIMVLFTYMLSRSLELRFGSRFLIKLFLISSILSLLLYTILRFAVSIFFPIENFIVLIGFAWGGILGLISFSIFPMMNQQITAIMMILPMRMKGRSFLILIILIRVFPLLFYIGSISFWLYMLIYLPDLGGIIGSYLLYKSQIRKF